MNIFKIQTWIIGAFGLGIGGVGACRSFVGNGGKGGGADDGIGGGVDGKGDFSSSNWFI